jgi:DNA-binding MarR family transcriptional regulator
MEDLFHVATSGLDITPRQFLLLKHIAKREGLSQTDLVKCTGIDRSTMADIVRRLVKKRYVQRRRTTNERACIYDRPHFRGSRGPRRGQIDSGPGR